MNALAETILAEASKFLGPEAKRFLERQAGHLEGAVTLDNIGAKDMEKFIWWINVSGKLIMDKDKVRELCAKLNDIAGITTKA
jgi:hypothetical protein